MPESLLDGDPLSRVQNQASFEETQGLLLYLADIPGFQRLGFLNRWKIHPIELLVPLHKLDLLLGQLAQTLPNQIELVHLILPGEHRLPIDQLAQYTPQRPDIRSLAVPIADQQFRTPVPTRGHILGQVFIEFGYEPGEAEIAQFQNIGILI